MNRHRKYNAIREIPCVSVSHVRKMAVLACSFIFAVAWSLSAQTTGTWTLNNNGNWSTTANWSGGVVPNGIGDTANITANISGTRTITLDVAVVLGTLRLGDSNNTNAYIIGVQGGANALTFDNGGAGALLDHMTGGSPSISPNNGDRIDSNVILNDSLTINMNRSLELRGSWTGNNNDITVNFGNDSSALLNFRATGTPLATYTGIKDFYVFGDGEVRFQDTDNVAGVSTFHLGNGTVGSGTLIMPRLRFYRTNAVQTADIIWNQGMLMTQSYTASGTATTEFTGTITTMGDALFNILNADDPGNNNGINLFSGSMVSAVDSGFSKFNNGKIEFSGNNTGFLGTINVFRGGRDNSNPSVRISGANGAFNAAAALTTYRDGEVWFDNTAAGNNDRFSDTGIINLNSVGLNHRASIQWLGNASSAVTETIGGLNFQSGSAAFGFQNVGAGETISLNSLTIQNGAAAVFHAYGSNVGTFFDSTVGAGHANIILNSLPATGTAAGLISNGVVVGAFGGGEIYNFTNSSEYPWLARQLMTVENVSGTNYLRPMTASDYNDKTISSPTHAFTEDLALSTSNVLATENVRLTGGFGLDTITAASQTRWDSSYRVTENITMNSLTVAQFYDTATSNPADTTANDQDGNRIILDLGTNTISLTTGMINFSGGGLYASNSGNLNIQSRIRGGTIDAGSADIYLNVSTVWDRTTSTNSLSGSYTEAFIGSTLAGSGNLVKTGAGTVFLEGANTYTGETLVHQGTLILRNANAIAGSSGVTVDAIGSLQLASGINVLGKNLTIGVMSNYPTALGSNNSHNTWGGDVIYKNVDAMGISSLFSARLAVGTNTSLTVYGNIYGDNPNISSDTYNNDPSIISAYNSGNGILNLRGAFKDTATGPITGVISAANENSVLRFQIGGGDELNVQVYQPWQAQGRIYMERGFLRVMPTISGEFWDSAAIGGNVTSSNGFAGFQLGGGGSTGASNAGVMLTAGGQVFNIDSFGIGGDSTNQTGNSMLGMEGNSGVGTFGTGTGTFTLNSRTAPTDPTNGSGGSVVQTYNRDLRLYAAEGGTLNIAARINDGGSMVNSSVTKIGKGTAILSGSTAGAGSVEGINVMDGLLQLDYTTNNSLRTGGKNFVSGVNILNGGTGYTVGNVITVTGGGGNSFRARVTSVDGTGAITGILVENRGQAFTGDVTAVNVALGSAAGTFAGTGAQLQVAFGAPLQMGGGVLEMIGNAGAATTETLAGLGVLAGGSEIRVVSAAGQTATLNLGMNGGTNSVSNVVRNAGGTLNFVTTGAGTSVITLKGDNVPTGDILGPWATFGTASGQATDWAEVVANNVQAFTGYANDGYATLTHTNVTLNQSFGAATTTATLRFNDNTAHTLDLGGNLLTLEQGGILVTSNHNAAVDFTNGSITSTYLSDSALNLNNLIVHQYGSAPLNLSAQIVDDALNSRAVSLVVSGSGVVDLSGNALGNTYSGRTVLNGGTLVVSNDNQLGVVPVSADTDNLWFHGGTLSVSTDVTLDSNRGVTIGGGGAKFDVQGTSTLTYGGVVGQEANVISSYASTNNELWGDITKTGDGTLFLNRSGAQDWRGLLDIQGGTVRVRNNNDAMLGSTMNFADGTIVRSGGTLWIDQANDGRTLYEWITLDGGRFVDNATGGNWSLYTGGVLNVKSNSEIEVANGDNIYMNWDRGGYIMGSGDITKLGKGSIQIGDNNVEYTGNWIIKEGGIYNRTFGDAFGTADGVTPGTKGGTIYLGNDGLVDSTNNGEVNVGFSSRYSNNGSFLGTSSQVGSSANVAGFDSLGGTYYINNDIVINAEGVGSTAQQNKRLSIFNMGYNGEKYLFNGNIYVNDSVLLRANQADSETLSLGESVHVWINGNLYGDQVFQVYPEQNANVTDPDNSFYMITRLTGNNSAYTGKLIVGGNSDAQVRSYVIPTTLASLPASWDLENNGYLDLRQIYPAGPTAITVNDLGTQTGLLNGRIITNGGELTLTDYTLTNQSFTLPLTDLNIAAAPAYDDQDPSTAISAATGKLNFIKDGPAYLTINNSGNSYTGYTEVIGGILRVENNRAMGYLDPLDTSTQTFVNVDPLTLMAIPGATGSLDLRGQDFRTSDALTEIFHVAGAGTNGLGALRNTSGTSVIGDMILYADTYIGGYSTATVNRHRNAAGTEDVPGIVNLNGYALNKLGTNEWRFHNVDIEGTTGASINVYEGQFKFENNGPSFGGALIGGTTYGNNIDGLSITVAYNRNAYDGANPLLGSRTSDPFNPNLALDPLLGNSVSDARVAFGTYWSGITVHPANTKVTDNWDNVTFNLSNGTIRREGSTGTGQTFDQIFGSGTVVNLLGGGIGKDAAGNGNYFDFTGGATGYNNTTTVYDHPGVTEIEGVIDNTSSGNDGTGFTKRGNRELRLTGDSSATFDGDVLVKQSTARYMAPNYNNANGAAESQYFSMSLAGANGSLAGAGTITVTRWGSLALLNNASNAVYVSANNDDRLNDNGTLSLRNGILVLETDTTAANHENFGNVVADMGTNYLYLDTRAGGQFDGAFQSFTTNNGGVLKIMDLNGGHTFGVGAGDDRIALVNPGSVTTVGSNAHDATQNVVLGLFGGSLPSTFAARTGSGVTRTDYTQGNAYAYGGSGVGLMTLDGGYLRPLTVSEYTVSGTPVAGTNWLVNSYIAPTGGNYADKNNYAALNVSADLVVNSLTIAFDAASSGQAIPTATKDYVIIAPGSTLTIASGIINFASYAEATSANMEALIRGGNISMNGGTAYINSALTWGDTDSNSGSWSTFIAGNNAFIRSHIINATDLVKTGRNNLYLDTWNDITGNIYVSEQASLIARHTGALGSTSGRELLIGGAGNFLLDYGTTINGINVRVTNTIQGSTTVLRGEGAYHNVWGGDVILDTADASGSSDFQSYTITARNNGTLSLKGNIYTDHNANFTDSDVYADPPVVTTNIGESYTLNLFGQFRDVATGNLSTDPANAAITSVYRTGDSLTRLDANHSLRFQMTGHDEGNVNVFQQWDATGRLDLNRGYFRIMYDPNAVGNDGSGFLTSGANSLILGNDYWNRAALGADGAGTGTYHAHLMLTKADQVFNWGNFLYVYNNNRDGTLSIGGEHESGTAYVGSDTGDNYQIVFENQGGDRDLRFLQVRGGTLDIKARLLDNGTGVNSIATVSGPGTVIFHANGAGQSTVERWNFMGGEAVWAPRSTDGSMLGNDRFGVSAAQALFGGGDLTVLGEAAANRNFSLTGNVWVNNGESTITLDAPSGRTFNLNFGSGTATLTKNAGGTLAFIESGAGTANITMQATGLTNTGIMSWAVFGNATGAITTFANNGTSGALSGYSAYVLGTAETDFVSANNVDVTSDVAFSAAANPNTLRFNTPTNLSLDGQTMTVNAGGILITSANGGANAISGGTLTSGFDANLGAAGTTRDLMIHNWNAGQTLNVSAVIADNGADKVNLVIGGNGTTALTSDNTYTGDTYLNGGSLMLSSESQLGDINGSISRLARVNVGSNNGTANGSLFFLGGGGSGATGTFTANTSNQVTGTTLTAGGSGYTSGVFVNAKSDGSGNAGIWAMLDSGNIHFDGGTLAVMNDVTLDGGRTLFLGANGGTLNVAAGSTLTINGYITSEFSQINSTNGYTANMIGGSDQPASDRNPDIGDLIIEGGGTVSITGAPDNVIRSNMYNSYGGITWINNGILRIAGAGTSATGALGTNRSFIDGTIIGANGTLMFNTTSDPGIYEWFDVRGSGYQGLGAFASAGTARSIYLRGQMNFEVDTLFNVRNNSIIRLNDGGGDTFGSGDIIKLGANEFYFYGNIPNWTGDYRSAAGNTRLYGAASLQGMGAMYLDRNTYLGYGAGSTTTDEFRDRLPDNLPVYTNGYIRMRMEAGGGVFSGIEKLGVLNVMDGQVGLEFDLGADLLAGAARPQGDYAGWHFTEIVRNPGTVVNMRNLDYGTSFADSTFNVTNFTNTAVVQVDVLPTLIGSGDGLNGNAPVAVGFFGGTRPGWINAAGTGQLFNEDYTANRLVTVDTNSLGEHFLRPLFDSEYNVISNPDTAQTSTIALENQVISADQNLKIVGVVSDTGIGAGELANRRNSILTLGSVAQDCTVAAGANLVVNSLTFASETYADGVNGRGNYTALIMSESSTLKINSGMIEVFNIGVQDRNGLAYDANQNLDIRSAINGGSVDFNAQEAIFNIGSLWVHYNTSDSLNAYRATDGDNNYLFMNSSITNATNLVKTGPASLILQAPNYYTGNTYVNYGALYARHDLSLGTGTGATVDITGFGTLVIGYGAKISGKDLYVGRIGGNNTALQLENNSVWAGNVIIDNVDSAGGTSFIRNFTPRIFSNTTGTATIEGNIFGGTTPISAGATDSRMFSTYTGAFGLLDIKGQVRDTATGAVTGPIDWTNQANVLRMEVTANNNESAVQLDQQYDAAGRIRLIRGALYYNGTGNFYTTAAATTVNSAPTNPMLGLQMGGRDTQAGNGTGAANLSFFLLNGGANFNLKSWEVGVETFDPDNLTGNSNYGLGNTTGNSTIGGVNTSGTVTFGTGDGSILFTQATTAYFRDLGLFSARGGQVTFRTNFVDGGALVTSSITKQGGGQVNLAGSSAGDSTVENVNVMGGVLNLTNYAVNNNRRVGNGAALTMAGGVLVMDGSAASCTENFGSLQLNQGGNGISAMGDGVSNVGTISIAGSSITRAAAGTVHFQAIAGGVIQFSDAAMASVTRLGSYATYGSSSLAQPDASSWAATDATGKVVAFTGYGVDTFGAGVETDVQSSGLAAGTTNSVRFNIAAGSISSGALTLNDGGILITSSYAGGTPIAAGVGVTTAGSGVDLLIHNYSSGTVHFDGNISGAQKVVFTGVGTLVMNAPSTTTNIVVNTTTTANNYTAVVTSTAGLAVGQTVTGSYIQPGTQILSITDATHIVLSKLPIGTFAENVTYTSTTYSATSTYTGDTHVTGAATLLFNSTSVFGSTGNFYLNGGTLNYTETAAYSAPITQSFVLGGNNGTIQVSDAQSTLIFRATGTNQFSSETANIIAAYGTNNPNAGGLQFLGSGTVQFGDRSATSAIQDLLGVQSNYTGLTIIGDGVNPIRIDIQGQGNDNAQYSIFGTTESWSDATIVRNNATIEFSMKRGDGSRDNQIRFREWFQIGEQAGDQILFDGSTGRQPTLDGILNIIGDLTFQTQGNRYADAGSTGNSEFLISANEGGVMGSGNIIKLGDGNLRFYTPLHEWTGNLDVQDGFLGLQMNSGAIFNPNGVVYFGDPTSTQTSTIQMRIENRFVGNNTTGLDAANFDLTFNRDIIVRDNLKQEVRIAAGYLPASSMIHFTNPINVGSGSTSFVRFYYEDNSNLDANLVGHVQNAVFDITGNITGGNNVFADNNVSGGTSGNGATFTVWLRGDNSGYSGYLTIGADNGSTFNPGRRVVVRMGSVLALGTNSAVGFRNGGTLQLAGLNYTTDKSFLFTGGPGQATTAGIENGSDTPVTLTLNSILTGVQFQDVGVGIRDGSAFGYFGSGHANISVVKTGTGNTIFGASTGGLTPGDFSSYTGTTTVSEGLLGAGSNYSYSPYSRFIVASGATLSAGNQGIGFLNTIGSLSGAAGAVLDIEGSGGFNVGGDNTYDANFGGVISGAGNFYKVGGGAQTLSGTNTWTGEAGVIQGTLIGANNRAFGDAFNSIYLGGTFFNSGIGDAKVELLLAGTANAVTNPVSMNSFTGNDVGITVIGTRATAGNYGFGTGGTVALYQDVATNVFFEAEGSSVFTFGDSVTNAGFFAQTNVVKTGTGTVELRTSNSYGIIGSADSAINGGTVVRSGTLALFDSLALASTVAELGDTHLALATDAAFATTRPIIEVTLGGSFDPASNGAGGVGAGAFINVKAEVDGVAITAADIGKRILIKDEGTNPERNGVYTIVSFDATCGTMTLTRATDFDEPSEMLYGTSIGVTGGTTLAGTRYFMASTSITTVNGDGTDPVHWLPDVSNPNVSLLAAASGLSITNPIDINDTNGTGTTTLGGTFTTGDSTFSGDITLQHSGLAGVDNIRELILTSASNDLNGSNQAGTIFTGAITEAQTGDVLSLTKTGPGTVTLTSPGNAYHGKTTVSQGTLALEGSGTIDSTSWLEVNAGATFDTSHLSSNTYTLDRPVTGSGTLTPGAGNTLVVGTNGGTGFVGPGMSSDPTNIGTAGNQIGVVTVNGNLTLTGDAVGTTRLALQLGATGAADHNDSANFLAHLAANDFNTWIQTQGATYDTYTSGNHDRLVVNGTLSLDAGGQISLTNTGYDIKFGDIFNLIDWTILNANAFAVGGTRRDGGLIGDFDLPTLGANLVYDTSLFASYGIVSVVPEPGRMLLLLSGLAALSLRRSRTRRII